MWFLYALLAATIGVGLIWVIWKWTLFIFLLAFVMYGVDVAFWVAISQLLLFLVVFAFLAGIITRRRRTYELSE